MYKGFKILLFFNYIFFFQIYLAEAQKSLAMSARWTRSAASQVLIANQKRRSVLVEKNSRPQTTLTNADTVSYFRCSLRSIFSWPHVYGKI